MPFDSSSTVGDRCIRIFSIIRGNSNNTATINSLCPDFLWIR